MMDRHIQYRPSRRKTDVPATVTVEDRLIDGRLVDISRDGAKFATVETLRAGSAVVVVIEEVAIPALVHWSRNGETGLRFLDRLDTATMLTLESAADNLAAFR